MKLLPSQLAYLLREKKSRRSVLSLLNYVAFLFGVIGVFTVLFHVIMLNVEGKEYSWLTGFYWALTVMSTLGFGDITFHTDVGRLFSIIVLLSGIVLLLIVLPFSFIQLFFAPWLEAQVRLTAATSVPDDEEGHVILCAWDAIAPGLARRLRINDIPHFVIEPDPVRAAQLHSDGVSVVTGEIDARETYERLRAPDARLLLTNREDTVNTNVTLTVREIAPELPILATANEEDSVDILELSGCTEVLAVKRRLGEMLVHRINTGHAQSRVIGAFHDLLVAEFGIHKTGFAGRTLGDIGLDRAVGVDVIGIWEGGQLLPAERDIVLLEKHVLVVLASPERIQELDLLLVIYDTNYSPALVIGGGKVGGAAVRELHRRNFPVHVVEKDADSCRGLEGKADAVFCGDAADREVLARAGIAEAPAVLLTTGDDAMNIYLAVYCRRLNPDLRIVSRVTHARNVEAIHRAGADFVMSYASLGTELVMARLRGAKVVLLGEQVELFSVGVPPALGGVSLAESGLREKFGLNVVAIKKEKSLTTHPAASTRIPEGGELVMLGSAHQREKFHDRHETV